MSKAHFLWVDDEIDLLKPYVLFLEEKGYSMVCANNGRDAVELCRTALFDIIFLDEQMPGLSGLETLSQLHASRPEVPVVMITKSEDEGIMNRAIGKKIADYLIKPVNPNQVLMTIKKILDKKELISAATTVNYRDEFAHLSQETERCRSAGDWMALYKKLVYWEMELGETQNTMKEMLAMQKGEANKAFAKFIRRNYEKWMTGNSTAPLMSPALFERHLFPMLNKGEKIFFILIDNFRLDQWQAVKDVVSELFLCDDNLYFSILPTATPYARNALFSGLMPRQIAALYPEIWVGEMEDEGKNMLEEPLIQHQLDRFGMKQCFSYQKINTNREGEKLVTRFQELEKRDLNVWVFNFIDMMSHARTESKMIRELTGDEDAYRSLTRSWFLHSPLLTLLKMIAAKGYKAVITTDHGAIRVKNGVKVLGDKETSVNLRYKQGRSLGYDAGRLFDILHPANFGLPSPNMSTRYIFATDNDFFVYPNNYNHHVTRYENSYQHGGISMEEMLVPCITLTPK
jgi:DNA-binding response OmpR family regulator